VTGPYRTPDARGEAAEEKGAPDLGDKRWTAVRGGVIGGWPEVDVHENGLVFRHSYTLGRAVVPFEEIDAIHYDYEGLLHGAPRVTLVCFDGSRSELPRDLEGLDRVLGELDRQVTMPITAHAKEALAAGQRMVFGPLAVELDGIDLNGQSLTWDHLSRVDAERDVLVFFAREPLGRFGWVAVRDVPHPRALVEVLRMRTTVVARGLPLMA
jgi:hypothetical protein